MVKLDGALTTAVPADWRERFVIACDIEIQQWVDASQAETAGGPSVLDGYLATAVSEAATTSLSSGALEPITIADRPSLYQCSRPSAGREPAVRLVIPSSGSSRGSPET